MPRNGSGVFSKPAGTTAIPLEKIEAAKFNLVVDDFVADANAARPITAGGTGATNAAAALNNLGAVAKSGSVMTGPLNVPNTFIVRALTSTALPLIQFLRSDDTVAGALFWDYTASFVRLRGYDALGTTVVSEITLGTNAAPGFQYNTNDVWHDGNANAKLVTAQAFGAVGSYAFLAHGTVNTAIGQGASYAGSALRYAGFTGNNLVLSGTAPSGTWQAIGIGGAASGQNAATLFRRIL